MTEADRHALRAYGLLGDPLVQSFPALAAAIALAASCQLPTASYEAVIGLIERLCKINAVVREIGPTGPEAEQARAEAAFRRAFPRWK